MVAARSNSYEAQDGSPLPDGSGKAGLKTRVNRVDGRRSAPFGEAGCFSCPASTTGSDTACRVSAHAVIGTAGSDEPGRPGRLATLSDGVRESEPVVLSDDRKTWIRRCAACRAAHARRRDHTRRGQARGAVWGATLGLLCGVTLDVILSVDRGFHAMAFFVPVLTVLLGALPGRLLGGLAARLTAPPMPAGIGPARDAISPSGTAGTIDGDGLPGR